MRRHLLIIGAQRCGTTSLANNLDAHRDITMARPSRPEPKVFLSADLASRGHAWYDATFFPHAADELVLGDKSTSYLEHPKAAPRAAAMLPGALILVQLRDPIDRAASNWRFSTDNGLEDRPLDQALRDNLVGPSGWNPSTTSVSPYAYLERGRYAAFLRPWLESFPGAVRVQFLEEVTGGGEVMQDLHQWLDVAPDPAGWTAPRPANASSTPAPPLDGALVAELRQYFSASDRQLAAYIGRQPPWAERVTTSG